MLYNKANMANNSEKVEKVEKHEKKEKKNIFKTWLVNPYNLVILSFIIVIVIGSFLLVTPLAQSDGAWAFNHVRADGQKVTYLDCLFTAVSATCVTGLCTFGSGIGNTLSLFGQIVVVIMIQIGGLGFITVLTFFITIFRSKLEFKNRYLISQMVGSTNFADVVKFVRRLILISISFVTAGTIIGLPVFFQMYPHNPWMAIWSSFFTSASAFNNAGFDLFGGTSLVRGMGNTLIDGLPNWAYYYLCTYLMVLIVSGGISFLVIIDIFGFKKFRQWRAFTKIVLFTTAILLSAGFLVFIFSECFHAGGMNVYQALFQSVTLRTAGFATYNQDNISLVGKAFSCLLMFIGGSPLSTAGGIKTTTAFMIFLAMFSYFRGSRVTAFKRVYSSNMIVKAMSLVFIGLFALATGFIAVYLFEENSLNSEAIGLSSPEHIAIAYEVFSAFGTVGVSTGITPYISIGSKIVLCLLMFLGRLGPMTFLQIFQANMDKKTNLHYQYVEEDFLIG